MSHDLVLKTECRKVSNVLLGLAAYDISSFRGWP